VLIVEIVAAVLVAVVVVALLSRRVSHDDVHSVEGYHRSLHTLETINTHPGVAATAVDSAHGAKPAYPESAVRLAGTSTVRVTDAPSAAVPPVPLPPLLLPPGADPERPVPFDDATPVAAPPALPALPEIGHRDKAMSSINHRPRRLAAPAMALAAVAVLIVVLLVTGSHSVTPRHHHHAATTGHTPSTSGRHRKKAVTPPTATPTPTSTPDSTPVTVPPTVSPPQASTASAATYQVAHADFTLSLSATSGACWIDVTNSTSGAPLFVGTLGPGQQHAFTATSPVTVVIGAPTSLATTVDGAPVQLPPGFSTPFTMSFAAAPAAASVPAST
jgi:hypothetical protein